MSSTASVAIPITPSVEQVATELERFVRSTFDIPEYDTTFSQDVDLFAEGYVDSVGVVEVVSFLEHRYSVTLPEDSLVDHRFTCVRGMAEIIAGLKAG